VTGAGAARLSRQDVTVLQAALAAEQAACYGYGVVGSHLSGAAAARADTDWTAHELARDSLSATITAAGADPVPAAVAYRLPIAVQSAAQATTLAVILEDRVGQAYIGLVGLTDLTLRALGARQLRAAALRAAAWSDTTSAFPGLPASSFGGAGSAPAISERG
jgi:Domain of unknown function (DUF4439)